MKKLFSVAFQRTDGTVVQKGVVTTTIEAAITAARTAINDSSATLLSATTVGVADIIES